MTKEQAEEVLKDEIALAKRGLMIPASGNPAEDQKRLHNSARSMCMIVAGFCPNGCGKVNTYDGIVECPACHFMGNEIK
jgi:hypothetical protein